MSATNGIGYHVEVLNKSGWAGCSHVYPSMAQAENALPSHAQARPTREFRAAEALAVKAVKQEVDMGTALRDWMVSAGLVAR
jgi:hypothetical protein